MVTASLPKEGKALYEKVYEKALKGSCKDDKECASKTAWSAVKGAGWSKGKDGKWHKKSLSEFSLAITRAAYDKATNRMTWRAVASDTDADSFDDNMTLELFDDFVDRIAEVELPPEKYRSNYWGGGEPYLSISHYPDLDGKAVPGVVEKVYRDGNRLKAVGYFNDTPLGRACFKSICKDLYGDTPHPEGKIRISIAFLDYSHKHKSNGFVWDKEISEDTVCLECVREFLENSKDGLEFLRGHLIHLALTRVPANARTLIETTEVDKMAIETKKDDALSIVEDDEESKEIIDEVSEQSLVGRSGLVIKSETEESEKVEPEKVEKSETSEAVEKHDSVYVEEVYKPFGGATSLSEAKAYIEAQKEEMRIGDIWYAFKSILENISKDEAIEDKPTAIVVASKEFKDMVADKDANIYKSLAEVFIGRSESEGVKEHILDDVVSVFRSSYDEVVSKDLGFEDTLKELQEPFNLLSTSIVEQVRSNKDETEEKSDVAPSAKVDDVVDAVMQKIGPDLAEIKSMLSAGQVAQPKEDVRELIKRRSLLPNEFNSQKTLQEDKSRVKSRGATIAEIVERTT